MSIEDLTKTQLVLLTLFTTFVTSIATGIITVVFLQEAPTEVTRTINRVVERTIEKVVPLREAPRETLPTQEDLVVRVVTAATPSMYKIYTAGPEFASLEATTTSASSTTTSLGAFRGLGFVVSADGLLVTSKAILGDEGSSYTAVSKTGDRFSLTFVSATISDGAVLFKLGAGDPPKKQVPLPFADSALALGKTVIAPVLGTELDTVALGSISGLKAGGASTTPILQTTLAFDQHQLGGPLFDTRGMVIGMAGGERRAIHVGVIKSLVTQAQHKVDLAPKNQ